MRRKNVSLVTAPSPSSPSPGAPPRRAPGLIGLALAAAALGGCSDEEVVPLNIIAFTVSGQDVLAGDTVTVSWSVEGAEGVSIRQSPGRTIVSGGAATGEIASDPLNLATTFTLTATSAAGEVQTRSTNVAVTGINIVSFQATPATVGRGEASTLSWRLGGSPPSEVLVLDSAGQNVIQPNTMRDGSTTVQPDRTETYTLRAQAGGVTAEAMATVTVMSSPPVIESFQARAIVNGTPQVVTTVARGTQIQLFWTVSNVEEVQVTANGALRRPWNSSGATSGNVTVTADMDRNVYLLEARNGLEAGDAISQELIINTAELPTVDSFSVTPERYTQSSTMATATWATTGAVGTLLRVNNRDIPDFPRDTTGSFTFEVTGEPNITLVARNEVGDTTATRMIVFGYDDAEPNDTVGQAVPLPGDGVPVRGSIGTPTDVDVYAVMVPEGASIFARVDPPIGGSCSALDPTLTLLDATGTSLGSRTTAGNTDCAEILPPEYAGFAEGLTAGMYFLEVSQEAGATTNQYSIDVAVIEPAPPLPNVSITRVSNPTWQVADFIQASVPWGRAADMSPELASNIAAIYGTRHRAEGPNILTTFGRPETGSVSDYTKELRTMVSALGFTSKNNFSATEWTEPNGLIVGYTLVPVATSTGTSRDFPVAPGGPVIDNGVLPVSIAAVVSIDGMEVGALPGAPQITGDPGSDGLSHMNVIHAIGSAAFNMAPPLPLNLTWAIQLRDQNSTGYDIGITTNVTN